MIGKKIGHYSIVERIGAGGMGEVYRAHDEHLDRDVALKILPSGSVTDPAARKRFRKEALTLAKLKHPYIGIVHDFTSQDDVDLLVMELISGEDLAAKIAAGPLAQDEVIRLGSQISEALEEAHENQIVHRDLKPKNIMLTGKGDVKVLDFGLAKLMRGLDQETTASMTETKGVLGTLPYMAPEQLQGSEVDPRVDVYALGVTLYEMATGRRPFTEGDAARLITAILRSPPPAPRRINPEISQDLERVILKALQKDREARYQTARELREDLQRLQAGKAVVAAPPGRSLSRRHALGTATLALVLAVLLVLNVGGLRNWLLGGSSELRFASLAVLPLQNLSGDPEQEYIVEGIHDALITDLAKISSLKVIARSSVLQYKKAPKSLSEIGKELHVGAVITGSVIREGDRIRISAQLLNAETEEHLWADRFDRDLGNILSLQNEVVTKIARSIQVTLTPQEEAHLASAPQIDPRAVEAYLKGRYFVNRFTDEDIVKGIEYYKEAIQLDPSYADAHAALGFAYYCTSIGHSEALSHAEACQEAKVALNKALQIDDAHAEAHAVLSSVFQNCDWDLKRAEIELERSLELNPGSAIARCEGAFVYALKGNFDKAIAELQKAESLDPVSPLVFADFGVILSLARRYDEGIEQFRRSLELDADFSPALGCMALAYGANGMASEAIASAERAVQVSGRNSQWLGMLGWAYAIGGKTEQAHQILQELDERSRENPVQAIYYAWIYAGLGDDERTFEWLEKAYEERSDEMQFLGLDPTYDHLREDPRFQSLMQRVGLQG